MTQKTHGKKDKKKDKTEELLCKISELEREIDSLKKERDDLKDRALRARADYENLMKRLERMGEEIRKYGNAQLYMDILSIAEDMERAIEGGKRLRSKAGKELVRGIEMIYRRLMTLLQNNGIRIIEDVGNRFDPNIHEAVMTVEDKKKEDGIIVKCVQRGYMLHDKVLIPSKVIVVRNHGKSGK